MKKTSDEIEADVFSALQKSDLKTLISGGIYFNGTRPLNSKAEDAVISFIAGIDAQVQTGVVNVNVYVPNIDNGDGALVKDVARCKEVAMELQEFQISIQVCDEYYFELDSIIKTFKADEIEEHFVNCRLKFKRITF